MSKVLSIVKVVAPARERRDMLQVLADLEKRARAGEITAIGVAVLCADGTAESILTDTTCGLALEGAIGRLLSFSQGQGRGG